jgi:Fe2+ transport system protein FeoA
MFFCKHIPGSTQGQRTLCDLREGEKAVVRCLNKFEGCHIGKLSAMGITPGTEIEMLSNGRGPLLVLVRASRLCLCRSLAKAVVVE